MMKTGDRFTQNLLISEPPLQVLPSLAVKVGLNEAIVLQQFHYWLQRSTNIRDGYKWVYNSYKEWNKQFPFWGLNTLKRAITSLEKSGYLISGNYNKAGFDKTKWYRINYDLLGMGQRSTQNGSTMNPEWVDGTYQNGSTNTNRLPETTTEITDRQTGKSDDGKNPMELWQDIWKQYPNGIATQDIMDWTDNFGNELVCFALKVAGRNGVSQGRADRYIDSVLQSYESKGIKTAEDARKEAEDHHRQYSRKTFGHSSTKQHWESHGRDESNSKNKRRHEGLTDTTKYKWFHDPEYRKELEDEDKAVEAKIAKMKAEGKI